MADAGKWDEFCPRNATGKVLGMFELNELIMLSLHDRNRRMDFSQIANRVIGFGPLHPTDCLGKGRELVRRGRQLRIIFGVSGQTSAEDWTGLDILYTAGIHVAGKEEDTCTPQDGFPGEDQRSACSVAPAHKGCFFQLEVIHHRQNVGSHQLISVWLFIARAVAMAAAVDEHDPITGAHQARNLITPITAVAEATMQHNDAAAGAKCRVPDSRALMVHVALIARGWQRSGSVPFEIREVVVA